MTMLPSSTVVFAVSMMPNTTFELLMHAAFVADEVWGFALEPALIRYVPHVLPTFIYRYARCEYHIFYGTYICVWYAYGMPGIRQLVKLSLVYVSSSVFSYSTRVDEGRAEIFSR